MFKNLVSSIHSFNAKRELTKYQPHLNKEAVGLSGEGLVKLINSDKWERFFWTKQVQSEFTSLAKVVENKKPKIVVEIGTNTGGTFFVFTKLAAPNAKIISIDLPGGKGGGGYLDFKKDFFMSFGMDSQKLFFIKSDSQAVSTYNQIKTILDSDKIDFLFIDGDHSYAGVKKDFELYSPLVNKGGLIAFHDIKLYPKEHWIKVGEFWNEIKHSFDFLEFIDTDVNWGGIGIIVNK